MSDRVSRILIHVVVLVIIFILPEAVMMGRVNPPGPDFKWFPYLKVGIFVAVFYIEYYLTGRSLSRAGRVIGSGFLLVAGVVALYFLGYYASINSPHHPPLLHIVLRDVAMLLLIMSLSLAMRLTERMRKIEETHRVEELQQLKSQLNPHFLFNSLNTVYALTEIDPPQAREAVHRLSALLRYALYEADSPTVKLGREIAFIKDYVGLMQMRLGDGVKVMVTAEISPGMENVDIASMLFVTLVENAFKHGNPGSAGAYISILVSADEAGHLECSVANTVDGSEGDTVRKGGVGLENLRRRLRLIYGDRARLEISSEPAIFVAQMRIDLL